MSKIAINICFLIIFCTLNASARMNKKITISREVCTDKYVNCSDQNYDKVLDYFMDCYKLGKRLDEESKAEYMRILADHILSAANKFIEHSKLQSNAARDVYGEMVALRNFIRFPETEDAEYLWNVRLVRAANPNDPYDTPDTCDASPSLEVKFLIVVTFLFLILIIILAIILFKTCKPQEC